MLSTEQIEEKFTSIFLCNAQRRQQKAIQEQTKFVHYTSADAAMSILTRKELWMRQPSCMNDYMEVEHGLDCLITTYRKENVTGAKFQETLNSIFPGISLEIEAYFNNWLPHIRNDTFITCISEHDSDEDQLGRLSMWRAYGSRTGVALVINGSALFADKNDVLKLYLSPVEYFNDFEFDQSLREITQNIMIESKFLASFERDVIIRTIFETFRFAILSTKHKGFKEEKEWRLIYSPVFQPSDYVVSDIQNINNIPQNIAKIPLKNMPELGVTGVEINDILSHIIIGPSNYPYPIYKAFVTLLKNAGVVDAEQKVKISKIPLRV